MKCFLLCLLMEFSGSSRARDVRSETGLKLGLWLGGKQLPLTEQLTVSSSSVSACDPAYSEHLQDQQRAFMEQQGQLQQQQQLHHQQQLQQQQQVFQELQASFHKVQEEMEVRQRFLDHASRQPGFQNLSQGERNMLAQFQSDLQQLQQQRAMLEQQLQAFYSAQHAQASHTSMMSQAQAVHQAEAQFHAHMQQMQLQPQPYMQQLHQVQTAQVQDHLQTQAMHNMQQSQMQQAQLQQQAQAQAHMQAHMQQQDAHMNQQQQLAKELQEQLRREERQMSQMKTEACAKLQASTPPPPPPKSVPHALPPKVLHGSPSSPEALQSVSNPKVPSQASALKSEASSEFHETSNVPAGVLKLQRISDAGNKQTILASPISPIVVGKGAKHGKAAGKTGSVAATDARPKIALTAPPPKAQIAGPPAPPPSQDLAPCMEGTTPKASSKVHAAVATSAPKTFEDGSSAKAPPAVRPRLTAKAAAFEPRAADARKPREPPLLQLQRPQDLTEADAAGFDTNKTTERLRLLDAPASMPKSPVPLFEDGSSAKAPPAVRPRSTAKAAAFEPRAADARKPREPPLLQLQRPQDLTEADAVGFDTNKATERVESPDAPSAVPKSPFPFQSKKSTGFSNSDQSFRGIPPPPLPKEDEAPQEKPPGKGFQDFQSEDRSDVSQDSRNIGGHSWHSTRNSQGSYMSKPQSASEWQNNVKKWGWQSKDEEKTEQWKDDATKNRHWSDNSWNWQAAKWNSQWDDGRSWDEEKQWKKADELEASKHQEGLPEGHFTVVLKRNVEEAKWGFGWKEEELLKKQRRCFQRAYAGTPIHRWNQQNPDNAVQEDDELIQVNSSGRSKIAAELTDTNKTTILCEFKRAKEAKRSDSLSKAVPKFGSGQRDAQDFGQPETGLRHGYMTAKGGVLRHKMASRFDGPVPEPSRPPSRLSTSQPDVSEASTLSAELERLGTTPKAPGPPPVKGLGKHAPPVPQAKDGKGVKRRQGENPSFAKEPRYNNEYNSYSK